MPNWCSTDITITSPDAQKIYAELNKALESNEINNKNWLGNLLMATGMTYDEVINGDIRCRGWVSFAYISGDSITICVEDAWAPHIKCVDMFCRHFTSDYKLLYQAEEPGCELYITNDDCLVGDYYFDVTDYEMFYAESGVYSKEDVVKILQEKIPNANTFDELVRGAYEYVDKNYPDEYFGCYEYEFVEIGDCD